MPKIEQAEGTMHFAFTIVDGYGNPLVGYQFPVDEFSVGHIAARIARGFVELSQPVPLSKIASAMLEAYKARQS